MMIFKYKIEGEEKFHGNVKGQCPSHTIRKIAKRIFRNDVKLFETRVEIMRINNYKTYEFNIIKHKFPKPQNYKIGNKILTRYFDVKVSKISTNNAFLKNYTSKCENS